MLSKVFSFALNGLDGIPVEVETDIFKGMVRLRQALQTV